MCSSSKKDEDTCSVNISNGLLLYYHRYSFYSQKVLMALYEKRLPFESHIIDLSRNGQYDPWFLKLNPRGEIPVLQDIDKIIPDSSKIIDYLEDNFHGGDIPNLIPMDQGPETRQKVNYYRHLIDQVPSGIITMGSFFHTELVGTPKAPFFKPLRMLLIKAENKSVETLKVHAEKNPDSRQVLLQKAEFQEKKHKIIIDKDEYLAVLKQLEDILDKVESELSTHTEDQENRWLCSNTFTVADISLTILLERLNQLGLEQRLWKSSKRPHVERYYERVRQRPSYRKTVPGTVFHMTHFLRVQRPVVVGVTLLSVLAILFGGYYIVRKVVS